jgi:hypothetical protein
MMMVSNNPIRSKDRDTSKHTVTFSFVEIAHHEDIMALYEQDFTELPIELLGVS